MHSFCHRVNVMFSRACVVDKYSSLYYTKNIVHCPHASLHQFASILEYDHGLIPCLWILLATFQGKRRYIYIHLYQKGTALLFANLLVISSF